MKDLAVTNPIGGLEWVLERSFFFFLLVYYLFIIFIFDWAGS